MGEQVGIQPRVCSQNNSRVLENAFRNVLQEKSYGKIFRIPTRSRAYFLANFRRGALIHSTCVSCSKMKQMKRGSSLAFIINQSKYICKFSFHRLITIDIYWLVFSIFFGKSQVIVTKFRACECNVSQLVRNTHQRSHTTLTKYYLYYLPARETVNKILPTRK